MVSVHFWLALIISLSVSNAMALIGGNCFSAEHLGGMMAFVYLFCVE